MIDILIELDVSQTSLLLPRKPFFFFFCLLIISSCALYRVSRASLKADQLCKRWCSSTISDHQDKDANTNWNFCTFWLSFFFLLHFGFRNLLHTVLLKGRQTCQNRILPQQPRHVSMDGKVPWCEIANKRNDLGWNDIYSDNHPVGTAYTCAGLKLNARCSS